jgi:HSP20 family protein
MTDKPAKLQDERREIVRQDPFRDWFGSPLGLSRMFREPYEGTGRVPVWSPAVDVSENKDGYAITVELAGANKDDVVVECHDNVLSIRGEKKDEREEKDEHRHFVERRFGSFSRSFRLPDDAQADAISASFKDGVLTLDVPRTEEKKPRVLRIE